MIHIPLYQFHELSPKAQEKALDWYRGVSQFEYDGVYEDFINICKILGVTLKHRPGRHPCIWFSGFAFQGDGACFEGYYHYAKGSVAAIKAYAPLDTRLHQIATDLAAAQRPYLYRLSTKIEHQGHYHHEYSMQFDGPDSLVEPLRDLARWLYRQLETEHDYQNSREAIAEVIEGYFTQEGVHIHVTEPQQEG